jgi:hypothetical protein
MDDGFKRDLFTGTASDPIGRAIEEFKARDGYHRPTMDRRSKIEHWHKMRVNSDR